MSGSQKLVLASGSPRRIELLQQAGIEPDRVLPTGVDETPARSEHPRSLAKRLSRAKAERAAAGLARETGLSGCFVLAADTVVAVGRRVLPKAREMAALGIVAPGAQLPELQPLTDAAPRLLTADELREGPEEPQMQRPLRIGR